MDLSSTLKWAIPLAAITALGGGLLYKLATSKEAESENNQKDRVTLAKIRQIVQEIKYQMLIVCVNFAEKMDANLLKKLPPAQLEPTKQKIRANIMKMYEGKEDIVLNKHLVSKEQFGKALILYTNDASISKNTEEIMAMVENAVQGHLPDLTVPPQALAVNQKEHVRIIYRSVCQMVIRQVWEKMAWFSSNEPDFDSKDDQNFKRAIRQINIYQKKVDFLKDYGYSQEWGCPNEVFFKTMQNFKLQDPNFRKQITAIEKAYNALIQVVSNNPLSITSVGISQMMESEVKNNIEEEKIKDHTLGRTTSAVGQVNYFFQKGKELQDQIEENKQRLQRARSYNQQKPQVPIKQK